MTNFNCRSVGGVEVEQGLPPPQVKEVWDFLKGSGTPDLNLNFQTSTLHVLGKADTIYFS